MAVYNTAIQLPLQSGLKGAAASFIKLAYQVQAGVTTTAPSELTTQGDPAA